MKLGINSYTFMWNIGFKGSNPAFPEAEAKPAQPLTPLGLLEKARELGVSLVQTGPNLKLEQYPPAYIDEFILTAKTHGITLELGTRGLDYEHLAAQIGLAKRMGANLIRTLPEVKGVYDADARGIPDAACQIIPMLEGEGVRLAIENGRIPAAALSAALDEVNSPWVGVVLDMVNSMAVPEGWKYVSELLARHTMCVHYKDFTIRREWHMMGFICDGTPAGKGMVQADWLFETLKASPYDFNVILELWPPEQASLAETIALEQQWAVESVPFLRQYIKE
jgi:sugar phosphate isomerase/epimerase